MSDTPNTLPLLVMAAQAAIHDNGPQAWCGGENGALPRRHAASTPRLLRLVVDGRLHGHDGKGGNGPRWRLAHSPCAGTAGGDQSQPLNNWPRVALSVQALPERRLIRAGSAP